MPILDKLTGLFSSGAAKLVESVGSTLDNLITNKEELAAAKLELTKEVNRHLEFIQSDATKQLELQLKDIDSARSMQVEALKQGDTFSKRFVYCLAGGYILFCFAFAGAFFFIDYPERNRDMINTITGVLISSGLVSIVGFFFGSSKGSSDKQARMDDMVDQIIKK